MSGGPGDRRHRDTRTANRRSGEQTPRAWGRGPTRKRPFRPLRWAWLLTNQQGYRDGVQLDWAHPDEARVRY